MVCSLARNGIEHVIENHSIMCGCSSKWKKAKISYSHERCVKVQGSNAECVEIKAFII